MKFPSHQRQRGVAAIELAFVAIPMLIAAFGITELGRALYQYNALVKGARDSVRYLAQQDLGSLDTTALADVRGKATALAVCGRLSCSGQDPLVPDLAASKVVLCDYINDPVSHNNILTGQGSIDLVTVRIGSTCANVRDSTTTVHFTSLMPWIIPDIDFSSVKTTMASRYF
jgi:TadE-like protein